MPILSGDAVQPYLDLVGTGAASLIRLRTEGGGESISIVGSDGIERPFRRSAIHMPAPSNDATGQTDSQNYALARALQAITNQRIIWRDGTYKVNVPVVIDRDYAYQEGTSRGRTTIQAVAPMNAVVSINGVVEVTLKDLTVDANGFANHELDMEHSEGTTRHHIQNVRGLSNHVAPVNHTTADGSITAGTAAFSSASAAWTSADVGKWILIVGAGASGINLFAQIQGVTDGQHITLDRNAGTTTTTATFQYFGFSMHNIGCEDVKWDKVEVSGSEASPGNLKPQMLLSHPSGLGSLYGCDIFGPVFYDALSLTVDGSNIGPLVSVNQAASQSKQLHVKGGTWIFDGGTPTSYRPFDAATTYLVNTLVEGSHLVAALANGFVNGRLPGGNGFHFGKGNVYVQPSGNTNTTMTMFTTSSGTSNTLVTFEQGKFSIGGSMTTCAYNSGGSATHTVDIRGRIDGATTYTNFDVIFNAPAVPASGTSQVNASGKVMRVYVTGGTVTQIAINGTNTGLTSGAFDVVPGGTITLTYSVAPTWVWK